jgi:hypothetical protein
VVNSLVEPLLAKLTEAQNAYEDLVEEIKIPNYFEASRESAHIKANASFNQYIWYLLFIIIFMIALFFILKNPESGNLDMYMLVFCGCIIGYYGYQYYVMKQRMK